MSQTVEHQEYCKTKRSTGRKALLCQRAPSTHGALLKPEILSSYSARNCGRQWVVGAPGVTDLCQLQRQQLCIDVPVTHQMLSSQSWQTGLAEC